MTPADLIKAKRCTGACLAATSRSRRCGCPCHGATHGLLSNADITVLIDARASGRDRQHDLEVVASAPA